MKSGVEQLTKYAEYHRDRRNIATHLIGVPMIVLAVCILLARPSFVLFGFTLSPVLVVLLAVAIYYLRLDFSLGLLLTIVLAAMCVIAERLAAAPTFTWLAWGLGLFVVGWIIQFIGHYYEGRKPAFVDDLVGLLIGPLFVLAEIVFALGLRRDLRAAIEQRVGPTVIRQLPGKTAS